MKVKWIPMAVAAGLFLTVVYLIVFSHRQDLYSDETIFEYNNGWEYCFDGQEGVTDLPCNMKVPENVEMVLVNTLPSEVSDGYVLAFRSRMESVRVYVDDQLVYRYPEGELIGREIPSAWNFVELSKEDAGKRIRICLESDYGSFSGAMSSVRIGNYKDLTATVISEQIKVFRMSLMVGLVGLAILVISFISRKKKILEWQSSLGLLLMVLSCWLCGESRMPSGYVGVEAWHYMAFLSLPLCPIFLTSYLYARWKDIHGEKTKILFYICLTIALGIVLSELLGGPDLVQLLPVTQFMVVVTLIYALWIYFLAARQKEGRNIDSELVCVMIAVLAGLTGIVRFYQTDQIFSLYIRLAILLYALNILRISVVILLRKIRQNQELERELRRSRAELMASQIKPHFIYNTLSSIRTLISLDPQMAKKMVYDFTTYLRSNLDNVGDRDMIPFSDELRHIQAYLNIEKVRFEERLNIVADVRTRGFQVPPLSIQPLVENAVKHGICKRAAGGTVTIRTYEEKDAYVVQIEDDGGGFDVSTLRRHEKEPDADRHLGLENIRFRIQEIADGTLYVESVLDKGTKVTVAFPKSKHK